MGQRKRNLQRQKWLASARCPDALGPSAGEGEEETRTKCKAGERQKETGLWKTRGDARRNKSLKGKWGDWKEFGDTWDERSCCPLQRTVKK